MDILGVGRMEFQTNCTGNAEPCVGVYVACLRNSEPARGLQWSEGEKSSGV